MNQIATKRKLHDAWALILYLVVGICMYGFMITVDKPTVTPRNDLFLRLIGIGIGVLAIMVVIMFIGFLTFPFYLLHLGFIFTIASYFVIPFLFKMPIYAIIFSLIFGVLSLCFYIFYAIKYIKFTAKVLKATTKIILQNSLSLFAFYSLMVLPFFAQIFFLMPVWLKVSKIYWYDIAFVFFIFWTNANAGYSFMIFASSIVAYHLFDRGVSSFLRSLKNTFYCLGSVCLGGLLIAIVQTLRYIIDKHRAERNREERTSFLEAILLIILAILLAILEDIISFINDWLFVYMAIHGKSYKDSLKESFSLISNGRNTLLINNIIIDSVLGMFFLLALILYGLGIYKFAIINITVNQKNLFAVVTYLFFPIIFFFFSVSCLFVCFSAGVKTLMFVYAVDVNCVRDECPEVYDAVLDLERKGLV